MPYKWQCPRCGTANTAREEEYDFPAQILHMPPYCEQGHHYADLTLGEMLDQQLAQAIEPPPVQVPTSPIRQRRQHVPPV